MTLNIWGILAGVWLVGCFVGDFDAHEPVIALLCAVLAFETDS